MNIVLILFGLLGWAGAEEKTCLVQGMECENCVRMITKDVCEGAGSAALSTCRVTLEDRRAHVGQVHVATKDPEGKIDFGPINAAVEKMNYTLAACADGPPKAKAPTAKKR